MSTPSLMYVICTSHMFTDSLLSSALTYKLVYCEIHEDEGGALACVFIMNQGTEK
jgi:hypothetical protein